MDITDRIKLLPGDCMDVLATLADDSLDSCVTDPPYHLTSIVKRFGSCGAAPAQFGTDGAYARASAGFMGKQWDGGDVAFRPETWAEVYRVLKPGAHLLAFGGTRTYHRMACAIEDAGFEIRDCIAWVYGQGFPKSHSVTKGLGDAICSCEAIPECGLRSMQTDDVPPSINATDKRGQVLFAGVSEQGASTTGRQQLPNNEGREKSSVEGRRNVSEAARQLREREIRQMPTGIEGDGASGRLRDGASACDGAMDRSDIDANRVRPPSGSSTTKQRADESGTVAMQPKPQVSGAWSCCGRCGKPIVPDGFGTALKPALEPIVLARKPLSEKTVAANVLRWGTGAINIRDCRVGSEILPELCSGDTALMGGISDNTGNGGVITPERIGRWPANVIHDGSDEVVKGFPESGNGSGEPTIKQRPRNKGWCNASPGEGVDAIDNFGDSGSAARFFYTAKADQDDRIGSKHPTVKPLDLMQYLVRLVTPKGGTVLDCFAGTGTTGEAAFREGMKAVLIEREAEYLKDITRRMELCMAGPVERQYASIKAKLEGKPRDDGPLFGGTDWDSMWQKPFDRPDLV